MMLIYNNMAVVLRGLGDLTRAHSNFEQSLAISRRLLGNNHHNTAKILANLASVEVASGRITEGFAKMNESMSIDDLMIGQVFSIGSDRERLHFVEQLNGFRDSFLTLVYQYLPHSPEAIQSALNLVLRRKAIAAEALAVERAAILGGRYPEMREAFDQLTAFGADSPLHARRTITR